MSAQHMRGINRTATLFTHPNESKKMLEAVELFPPTPGTDGAALLSARSAVIRISDPIGSIPLPLSPRGAVETVKGAVSGQQPLIFTDKLGERLAFERTGTRLYEAFLGKLTTNGDQQGAISVGDVERIIGDEHQHFLMLRQAIERLGGDPTAVTPCADVVGVQSLGLVQVMTDPRTTVDQCLSVLLTAELVDNDCWELLATLADGMGHGDMATEFRAALSDEQQHLMMVRGWVQAAAMREAGIDPGSQSGHSQSGQRRMHPTS